MKSVFQELAAGQGEEELPAARHSVYRGYRQGGTSLSVFSTVVVSIAMSLQGAPKLAFHDGLLHQSVVPESVPEMAEGLSSEEARRARITS